ncbi:hypothetical protein [Nitrosomonas communis]|uniref:hypothetical protein n=1 Tax=Nitrosomonas communis TaxID=44574 RepID=UPI001160B961|nr:hypothetical protein [Nitrosomonas communis]
MLRVLAAIAIDAYGYDPEAKKSPIPQEISDVLSKQGISLSSRTIRDFLKEGINLLPAQIEQ